MLTKASDKIPYRIAIVLLPKFSSLTLASMVEPMRIANYSDGRQLYHWQYVSADGQDVPGCSGYSVPTELCKHAGEFDAIIVCGGWTAQVHRCQTPPSYAITLDNLVLRSWDVVFP